MSADQVGLVPESCRIKEEKRIKLRKKRGTKCYLEFVWRGRRGVREGGERGGWGWKLGEERRRDLSFINVSSSFIVSIISFAPCRNAFSAGQTGDSLSSWRETE